MAVVTKQQALDYHNRPRPGKIEITPTKPCRTQRDLSLAYTPGVADPCLEIQDEPPRCLQIHGARQPGRSGQQWHRRAGSG